MGHTRHLNRVAPIILLALAAANFVANPAWALPKYKDLVTKKYNLAGTKLDSCVMCHVNAAGGGARNAFGKAFQSAGMNEAALKTIASKDSDGDGVANEAEIKAGTFPGDAKSKPAGAAAAPKAAAKPAAAKPAVDPLLGLWKHLAGNKVEVTAVKVKLTPEQTSALKAAVAGTKDSDIEAISVVKAKNAAGAPVVLLAHKLADGRYLGVARNEKGAIDTAVLADAKLTVVEAPYLVVLKGLDSSATWTASGVPADGAPADWDLLLVGTHRMLVLASYL